MAGEQACDATLRPGIDPADERANMLQRKTDSPNATVPPGGPVTTRAFVSASKQQV